MAAVKILILAHGDWAGAGHALAEAVREYGGHEVCQVAMRGYWTDYPADEIGPNPARLRELLDWADVWNLVEGADSLVPADMVWKPTIVSYYGTSYRRQHEDYNRRASERGWLQTCTTQDLSLFGPAWLPPAQPDLSADWRPEPGLICHAPTNRAQKGTDAVINALDGLPGIRLEIVERLPWRECLTRKARAWLYIDQVGPYAVGYGVNSLEAWAYGMPVICGAAEHIEQRIAALVGEVPYMRATPETLRDAVERFRDDEVSYRYWAEAGRRVLAKHHAQAVVARQFVEMCEKAGGR
jgi:hypothetical protein